MQQSERVVNRQRQTQEWKDTRYLILEAKNAMDGCTAFKQPNDQLDSRARQACIGLEPTKSQYFSPERTIYPSSWIA